MRNKVLAGVLAAFMVLSGTVLPLSAQADTSTTMKPLATTTITRLAGQNRYQTASMIAESVNDGPISNIILASGNGFADALPASVLAHKLNAPILLIDSTVEGSTNALDYISEHLDKAGTIYIIGGSGVIGPDFKNHLKRMGYANINQIGGQDRYNTAYLLAQQLNAVQNTPVVISAGENYPDTLSISTFAAENSWPILLVQADSIDPDMLAYIQKLQPDKIYITGGIGVVSPKVEETIKAVAQKAQIKRLAGSDRFATAREINAYFAPNPKTIYVASGLDYPDALAGSVLAAKSGSPIVLVDPAKITPPKDTLQFLMTLHQPDLCILGGTGVIPAQLASNIYQLLNQGPLTMEPVTKGNYTISCSQSVNSALQFTGRFSLNIQWVGIRASREGNDYWSFVKPIDGQVDKGIYLQGPGTYSLAVCTSMDPQGPYGIMFYVDTIFGGIENLDTRDMSFLLPSGQIESNSPEIINLSNTITQGLKSDMEKTKAIHDWIAHNIAYDYKAIFQGTPSSVGALDTLRKKSGICQGYSELNAALHRAAGIRAKVISGVALGAGMPTDWSQIDKTMPNHAWNEVLIDGKWIIEDTTWDAGGINEKNQFVFSYLDTYFNPTQAQFAINHLKIADLDE